MFSGYEKALSWLAAGRIPLGRQWWRTVSPRDAAARLPQPAAAARLKNCFLVWDWTALVATCTLAHGLERNTSGRPRRGTDAAFHATSSVYHHDLGNNGADAQRTVFLVRRTERSGHDDFRLR